jgi:glyoxylase-like metal-dependent hydrolase (beta-lactamase superfamily II)
VTGELTGTEAAPGIWSIPVPTPWAVGPVNAYLIEDEPLTLIDTGPIDAAAIGALESALDDRGYRVEDLGRVIVSHQHIDHLGLAAALVERSGAELCALEGFDRWLAEYPGSLAHEDAFADDLLRRHGGGLSAPGARVYRGDLDYGASAAVERTLVDGGVLEFAERRLRVLHRPGHSPSDTVFHDEERAILFGADHVLAWPSTPILSPPLDGTDLARGRPRAFAQYMTSLRATQVMELDIILPGHGEPVRGHREIIAERLKRYDRIIERVAAAVGDEPRTALEIAAAVRGPIQDHAMFFALCDVLGSLDELLDAGGAVERQDADGVTRFAAV